MRQSDVMIESAEAPLEAEIHFDPARLSARKEIVRRFYKQMWDQGDISLIPELFHENFTFRGSLGPVLIGYPQLAEYVRWVIGTFDDYTSDILALIEEANQIAAKLRFHGFQRQPLFGRLATGKHVWWNGAAIFSFEQQKIRDLWVLGDIYGLLGRLDGCVSQKAEFTIGNAHG
jgi:SnoaL-like polyketide cyclase